MLKYHNDPRCPSNGFYTYNAFIKAARYHYSEKRRLPHSWARLHMRPQVDAGLVHQMVHMHGSIVSSGKGIRLAIFAILLIGPVLLVDSTTMAEDPFNSLTIITMDKRAEQLDRTFINNPDLVATDAVISFKTTIWFWMTPQGNKPSSHDVISGRWTPSAADRSAGRVPGYGVITNIINGSVGKAQMIRWLIGLGSSGGTATCWELAMDTT